MSFADQSLEDQIAQWRTYVRRRALQGPDVEELEGHLRDQLSALTETGLTNDEAFLVAVKRMGSLDALSREFARAHSERLWKQLVIAPDVANESANTSRTETIVVLILAVAAALAIKVPVLFGHRLSPDQELPPFYARNASLFVFPLLTFYFVWKRRSDVVQGLWLALPFIAGAVFANVFPFRTASDTQVLTVLHLPIALWLAVGVAYVGGHGFSRNGRMFGYTLAASGRTAEARRIFQELERAQARGRVYGYHLALIAAGLGDRDQMYAHLNDAVDDRDVGLTFLRVESRWRPYLSEGPFQEVLERVGICRPEPNEE